jgi:hypothetical protein
MALDVFFIEDLIADAHSTAYAMLIGARRAVDPFSFCEGVIAFFIAIVVKYKRNPEAELDKLIITLQVTGNCDLLEYLPNAALPR